MTTDDRPLPGSDEPEVDVDAVAPRPSSSWAA